MCSSDLLTKRAKELEAKRDGYFEQYHAYEISSLIIQLGIVMCSVALLTSVMMFAGVAMVLGGAGLAVITRIAENGRENAAFGRIAHVKGARILVVARHRCAALAVAAHAGLADRAGVAVVAGAVAGLGRAAHRRVAQIERAGVAVAAVFQLAGLAGEIGRAHV